MWDWIQANPEFMTGLGIASALGFVLSILGFPLLIARIPEDYFASRRPPAHPLRNRHPLVALAIVVLKNLAGAVLVLAGIVMLLLPGQGVLTILLGLMLLNFPGKRRLELGIVRHPRVRRALNWLRKRHHKPPLIIAPVSPESKES